MQRASLRTRGLVASFVVLSGCATQKVIVAPVSDEGPSFHHIKKLPPGSIPTLEDDYDPATLARALQSSIQYYDRLPPTQVQYLDALPITAQELKESMQAFLAIVTDSTTWENRQERIEAEFDVYQSRGISQSNSVTFSSYYEPTYEARLAPDAKFKYPFYARPDDLIEVPLDPYDDKYRGQTLWGRVADRKLGPYYTREQIDGQKLLEGKGLEIAWTADPLHVFFMQIEGSGWLDVGNGEKVRIRYAANNGHRYRSVGQTLISSGKLGDKKSIGHNEFHQYVLNSPERQAILNINPRYIFFRLDKSSEAWNTYGNINVPLTPGRSVATDPAIFPRGALAWMRTTRPIFDETGKMTKTGPLKRFILNQDEGGAIKGAGRVDFYVGGSAEAERFATHFWQKGELYFLVKKKPKTP